MDASGKKQWGWALMPLALLLGAGCHTTQPITTDEFAVAPVHQVHVTWSNKITVTTDYGHDQGADLPGLVGRLYLMGPDLGHTVKSNGRVVVDLYDAAQPSGPKFLGRWQISKENLARLGQKDVIGLGYTLFLPWPDYKPDASKLQLQVSYLPEEGPAMIAPRSALTLSKDEFKSVAALVRARPIGQEQPQVTPVAGPGTGPNGMVLETTQETH